MWLHKSVVAKQVVVVKEIKTDEKNVWFYLDNPIGLESAFRPIKCFDILSSIVISCVCFVLQIASLFCDHSSTFNFDQIFFILESSKHIHILKA